MKYNPKKKWQPGQVIPVGAIVYKALSYQDTGLFPYDDGLEKRPIAELLVTEPGIVPWAGEIWAGEILVGIKGRVRAARVLSIDGRTIEGLSWCSGHDRWFRYIVGDIVRPRYPFDDSIYVDCGSGIHVFRTRREARKY